MFEYAECNLRTIRKMGNNKGGKTAVLTLHDSHKEYPDGRKCADQCGNYYEY